MLVAVHEADVAHIAALFLGVGEYFLVYKFVLWGVWADEAEEMNLFGEPAEHFIGGRVEHQHDVFAADHEFFDPKIPDGYGAMRVRMVLPLVEIDIGGEVAHGYFFIFALGLIGESGGV